MAERISNCSLGELKDFVNSVDGDHWYAVIDEYENTIDLVNSETGEVKSISVARVYRGE